MYRLKTLPLRLVLTAMTVHVVGCSSAGRPVPSFAMRDARLTDAVIARDIAHFDSLAVAWRSETDGNRASSYAMLARNAYERNETGLLIQKLLNGAHQTAAAASLDRSRRPDLWQYLDSMATKPLLAEQRVTAVKLEIALLRAQYEVLGAPSCAVWEKEAEQLAAQLRFIPPERPTPPVIPAPEPEPVPVEPKAPSELRAVPSRVHFALDKSVLAVASRHVLDALVDSLARYPDVTIVLEGHTDSRASIGYNEALSRRRAVAVRDYLLQKGISESRLRIEALGESRLDTGERDVRELARNRRVSLRYFAPDGREIPALLRLDDLQLERRQ